EAAPVPAALPGTARAVKVSRRAAGKRQRGPLARVAALWVVLVGIIFGVMQALSSRAPSPGSRGASSLGPVAVPLVAVALFASLVVVAIARARRLEGMLVSAQRAMTLGDHATAEPLLARLAAQ